MGGQPPEDTRPSSRPRDTGSGATAVYVYGAGGHAQVVADVLADMGHSVRAFVNDYPDRRHPAATATLPGALVAGADGLRALDAPLVMAVGDNRQRKQLVELLEVDWISAIHSSATIADTVKLGVDNVVLHGSIIQANARIGSHVLINTAASIDHDNVIGDFAHISPRATLCGHVEIGEGTHVGAAATVVPNVKIGRWCTIGAGAVVLADVPDHATAVGVPARIVGADA